MNTVQLTMKSLPIRFGIMMLAVLASIIMPAVRATSSPPDRMSYQGFLVDKDNNPLAPTTPINYQVIFRVYAEAEGGNALWAEEQVVTVDKGNFSVVLGEGTAVGGESHDAISTIFADTTASDRYIGITVTISGSPLTLLPRLRLLPSPYSFLATQAVKLVNPSTGVPFVSQSAGETTIAGNGRTTGDFYWGTAGLLKNEQGGSMELGNSLTGGVIPYIDFHYGKGSAQDYNMRLINDGDARLSLYGGRLSFGTALGLKMALWDGGANDTYGLGIDGGTLRLQVGSVGARFGFFNGTAGSEVFTVRGNGNVGIGTVNPKSRFHNTGESYLWGHIMIHAYEGDGSTGTAYLQARDTSGTSSIDMQIRTQKDGGIRDVMRITRDGYVGIGTTGPSAPLHVYGGNNQQLRLQSSINGIYWDIYSEHPGHNQWGHLLFVGQGGAYAWISRYTGGFFSGSDARLKQDIEPMDDTLNRVLQLRPVSYRLKSGGPDSMRQLGFIAQEVEPLFPSLVTEANGMKGISYAEFAPITVSAIQSLHKIVEAKESRIKNLEAQLADVKKQLAAGKEVAAQWENRMTALEKKFAAVEASNKTEVVASKTR